VVLDRQTGRAKALDHSVEVVDPEVDLPALLVGAEGVRIGSERREHALAALLKPAGIVVAAGMDHDHAEMLGVPAAQRLRIPPPEEEAANPRHSRHRSPSVTTSAACAACQSVDNQQRAGPPARRIFSGE
jgi:hypothetical protein